MLHIHLVAADVPVLLRDGVLDLRTKYYGTSGVDSDLSPARHRRATSTAPIDLLRRRRGFYTGACRPSASPSGARSGRTCSRSRAATWAPCLRRPRRYQRGRCPCGRAGSPPVCVNQLANRDASTCRRAVKTSTASPPRRQRVDGVEVDANFRARRRRERRETLILARLATAGVSLFLFLAMVCNSARVAASSDVTAVVLILAWPTRARA